MNREELCESFDHFDEDDNGRIDLDEFKSLMRGLDDEMNDEEIDMGFDIIDTDDNGEIDFDEFVAWWSGR